MIKNTHFPFALCLTTIFIFGCQQPRSPENRTAIIEEEKPTIFDPKANTLQDNMLYSTNCLNERTQWADIHFPGKKQTFYKDNLSIKRGTLYFTTDCDLMMISVFESGLISSSEQSSGIENQPIHLNEKQVEYSESQITLHNELIVTAFNQASICGFNDWELNKTKTFPPADLNSFTTNNGCPVAQLPRAELFSFNVENNILSIGNDKTPEHSLVLRTAKESLQILPFILQGTSL